MAHSSFWNAILLYVKRPNLINRRLIGSQVLYGWTSEDDFSCEHIIKMCTWSETSISQLKLKLNLIEQSSCTVVDHQHVVNCTKFILILRKLFRKQSLKTLQMQSTNPTIAPNDVEYDILLLFPGGNSFTSIPINFDEITGNISIQKESSVCYSLSMTYVSIKAINVDYLLDFTSNYWIEQILVPKIEQWMASCDESDSSTNTLLGSIKYISMENYCINYNRLKSKYSLPLLDIWSKVEKTDPIKFIFEDIAIAAYLITLWQEEQQRHCLPQRQTFADIGCGNGLLVYILTNENYDGYGIDVRKRNIWDHYGNNVKLLERQIDVFNEDGDFQLPKCDWMIGNHSDELTPWLVYMASCSSSFTRAFVLPCCCYDFDGLKFQRTTEPNKSQYQCYIDYLQTLCEDFGFKCFRDKLRIPSTKRICLVCFDRNYFNTDYSTVRTLSEEQIESIQSVESGWKDKRRQIVEKCLQRRSTQRLRPRVETVRNCTRIDPIVREQIIERLTSKLIDLHGSNCSDALSFNEAIQLLDYEMRTQLKNQCGGLQTFIRNHKHIFTICEFKIRFQSVDHLRAKSDRVKSKQCWFHHHHPQGCTLTAEECAYKH